MFQPAEPRQRALDAQAEPAVRNAAVTPQVQIPLERLHRQAFLVDARQQRFIVVLALRAADDLAEAFRSQHVEVLDHALVVRIELHVERFAAFRIAVAQHRLIVQTRNDGLVRPAEVLAPLKAGRQFLVVRNVADLLPQLAQFLADGLLALGGLLLLPLLAGGLDVLDRGLQFAFELLNAGCLGLQVLFKQVFRARAVQHVHGIAVAQPHERLADLCEPGHIAAEELQISAVIVQNARHQRHDEVLGDDHHVVEVGEGHLRLDHPELGEVPPRFGLLRPKRRPKAVHLAMRHARRLEIELAGLGQIHWLAEVVHFKECGRALAGGRCEDRCVDEHEAVVVEEPPDGVDQRVANLEDHFLPPRSKPQVAMLHQEVGAMSLRRDGVFAAGVYKFEAGHRQLVTALGPLLGPHRARHAQRRFLRQPLDCVEEVGSLLALLDYALAQARAVAHQQKRYLPARPHPIGPARQRHFLSDMVTQVFDVSDCAHGGELYSFWVWWVSLPHRQWSGHLTVAIERRGSYNQC